MKDKRALKMCESNRYNRGDYRAIVNDIANLTFLRQSTNSSIGNLEPAVYLRDIPAEIRRAHFNPDDPVIWNPERYEDFLDAADCSSQMQSTDSSNPWDDWEMRSRRSGSRSFRETNCVPLFRQLFRPAYTGSRFRMSWAILIAVFAARGLAAAKHSK